MSKHETPKWSNEERIVQYGKVLLMIIGLKMVWYAFNHIAFVAIK